MHEHENEWKMSVTEQMFNERDLDNLAMRETILKGVSEVWFGGVKAVKLGVSERVHGKEGVAC